MMLGGRNETYKSQKQKTDRESERVKKKTRKNKLKTGKEERKLYYTLLWFCYVEHWVVVRYISFFFLLTLWYLDPLPLIFACIFNAIHFKHVPHFFLLFRSLHFPISFFCQCTQTHNSNRAIFSLKISDFHTHSVKLLNEIKLTIKMCVHPWARTCTNAEGFNGRFFIRLA